MECFNFKNRVDELVSKVDQLEQKGQVIGSFFSSANKKQTDMLKGNSTTKDKDKDKHVPSIKKQLQDASRREAAAQKRMQDLIRQFGTILRQVIDKPMDFNTIKNQMELQDGIGYKHVREVCADVRLVFKNAMKYNDERSDVHVMAKTLLEKFEEKWLQFLPKVTEEETRREEEEAEAQLAMQIAQEAAHAKMARDLSNELDEIDVHLEELREMVVKRCRKMSSEEKRNLGIDLSRLSAEDLSRALDIVAETNPSFQPNADEVELDINAQSESTLWRLNFFVRDALEVQSKNSGSMDVDENPNNKRKRELCDAIAKVSRKKKKSKKLI
ncbi:unnamed protein product [Lathyrus oleraceus]